MRRTNDRPPHKVVLAETALAALAGAKHTPVSVDPFASRVTGQVPRVGKPLRGPPGPLRLPTRRAHRRGRLGLMSPSVRSGLGNGLRAPSTDGGRG
jgi:hypothetical protein